MAATMLAILVEIDHEEVFLGLLRIMKLPSASVWMP